MPRRRGVDDHEAALAGSDSIGEGAKDCDLLGTGASEIFLEQGQALGIKPLPGLGEHLGRITFGLRRGVDARYPKGLRLCL